MHYGTSWVHKTALRVQVVLISDAHMDQLHMGPAPYGTSLF